MAKEQRQTSRRKKNMQSSRKTTRNKKAKDEDMQVDRSRQRKRDEADDNRDEEDEEDEEKVDKEAEMRRYIEFLVKKDINDYFAHSQNAADQDEVFDRSERAVATSDTSGKTDYVTFWCVMIQRVEIWCACIDCVGGVGCCGLQWWTVPPAG